MLKYLKLMPWLIFVAYTAVYVCKRHEKRPRTHACIECVSTDVSQAS